MQQRTSIPLLAYVADGALELSASSFWQPELTTHEGGGGASQTWVSGTVNCPKFS